MTALLVTVSNIAIVAALGYVTKGLFLRLAAWVLFALTATVIAASFAGSIPPGEAAISGTALGLTGALFWFAGHVLHAITRGVWRSNLARIVFQRVYRVAVSRRHQLGDR